MKVQALSPLDLGWQPEVPKAIISFKLLYKTYNLGQILGPGSQPELQRSKFAFNPLSQTASSCFGRAAPTSTSVA